MKKRGGELVPSKDKSYTPDDHARIGRNTAETAVAAK